VPVDLVFYRQKLLKHMFGYSSANCLSAFFLFMRNLHPLFNIHFKFDILSPRLLRFIFASLQLGAISLAIVLVFGSSYRSSEFISSRVSADSQDKQMAVLVGLLLSLLTLPVP